MEDTDEQAWAKVPATEKRRFGTHALIGSPATIRQHIAAYEEAGVQELLLRFPEAQNLDALRRFADAFIR
jgi:alkanesulfonate monooxygenase SsuD/methylene tetrahydromethanopterin reductase-like flavin-dependent oxidoreductase (luciferase family)